jgi:hypothetical protein
MTLSVLGGSVVNSFFILRKLQIASTIKTIILLRILPVIKCIFLSIISYATILAAEIVPLPSTEFRNKNTTPFTFELATSSNQRSWGLMGRKELPHHHGMIFIYPSSNILSLWSFNCYIPLSVAFMDEEKVIRDLQDLDAYPEKMDPERPVYSLEDLSQYPSYDPILRFFQSKSIRSSVPTKYAMEMNLNWFDENEIKKGDVVTWKPNSGNGEVIHTWDLSTLQPTEEKMFLIKLARPEPVAVSIPHSPVPVDVVFFDSNDTVLFNSTLPAGSTQPKREKGVYYVESPVKRVAVLPGGWVEKNSIDVLLSAFDTVRD